MRRRLGLALLYVICASSARAHDPYLLDARRATAGPRLELVEIPAADGKAEKKYRIRVGAGLPKGVVFGVHTRPYDHGFHEVESGFQTDENGSLVATAAGGSKKRLEDLVVGPGAYPKGTAWELALVAVDKSVRLFAKVIPYPITASNGPCKVSLELVSHVGDRFNASGTGFTAGEEVTTEFQYSGRVIRKQRKVSADGSLAPELISHRELGPDRGARYTVRAQSCEVSIDYDWGEPALRRQ